jgi:hypothetical protein
MGLFSKKQKIPATGFYAQPKSYQNLYNNINKNIRSLYFDNGQIRSDAFTPMDQTADEARAFEMMRQGFAPTPESLSRDLAMLMNPFDDYVINDINRQAQGDYSLARQYAASTGQMGSNRDMLAASDVEQNRLNSIGGFRQSQYNNALDRSLVQLPTLRQNDAQNLAGIGAFERALDMQQRQAPYTALGAAQGAFNAIPTQFGNFGTEERTIKTGGGLGGFLGSIAPIVGSAIGGPIGGAIGGAVGGGLSGGGVQGMLSGALGGYMNGGINGGNYLGQKLGSVFSPSPMGPYQPVGYQAASFFR